MGHIQKRGQGRWSARYTDAEGRERLRSFTRKVDAVIFLKTTEADILRGTHIDLNLGKITLAPYAEEWLARQTTDPSTREANQGRGA